MHKEIVGFLVIILIKINIHSVIFFLFFILFSFKRINKTRILKFLDIVEVSIIRFDYDRLRWNTNRSRGNRFTSRSLEELLMFE